MADALRPDLLFWRCCSRCSQGGCVEVALLPDGGALVRDSTDPTREPLMIPNQDWRRFLSGVKHGQFDL